jgi:CARDB
MRLLAHTLAACGATALATGALLASPAVAGAAQASASVESCQHADAENGRSAAFVADMRAVGGTRNMAIRLDLQRKREGSTRWRTMHAAGLGEWHRSEPGVDIFRYRKLVANLAPGASFRVVARYRWYGLRGVIARAKRVTASCRQPDPRADLLSSDLVMEPGASAERARYVVTLRNKGRRAAGAFTALVYIDGVRHGAITVPDMDAHDKQAIAVEGPRCGVGSTVLVILDPDDAIDEAHESNNTTRFACPL